MSAGESLIYRKMEPGEEAAVSQLVVRVFDRFIAPLYPREGIREFLRYVQPSEFLRRSRGNHIVLVAMARDEVAGMIEVRQNNHISLLFVDERFHRRGVAGELLRGALEICLERKPDLREITVNSSPNSVQVYERLGFRPVGPEQVKNGIRFTPMVLGVLDMGSA